uniref:Evasin n=1 Tax=Amblyomma cajennense TaxID=34607 RepID=A0A023FQW1_AMBCJ
MGFPWLLNLALLFVLETSVGYAHGGATSIPPNTRIPGCGDAGTTSGDTTAAAISTQAAKAPNLSTTSKEAPTDEPKNHGIYIDKEGCKHNVLESWLQEGEIDKRYVRRQKRRRSPNRRVLRITDCRRSCNGTDEAIPDNELCLVAAGSPYGRRRHIKGGCFLGDCKSQQCIHRFEKVSCYVPAENTTTVPNYAFKPSTEASGSHTF